jgi:SWI/SNF-related matrix-associated actin-dependent regulator of chromatin subfamily A3
LKADNLVKAMELKKTRAEAESQRKCMGLKSGMSSIGLGISGPASQPQISLEEIVKGSAAVEFRSSDDLVKSLAMSEEQLARMPLAEQPLALKSKLLAYQLQVSHSLLLPYLLPPLYDAWYPS